MTERIVLLPGDGIGPEIMAAARQLLDAVGEFEFDEQLVGGASIDAHGTPLTDEVLDACRNADAVLLAAVGGPKWDTTDPDAPRPEQGLLGLRKELGLFANIRPVRPSPALLDASPLKRERIEGTDLIVVRELTGGIYFGDRGLTATPPTTPASTARGRSSASPWSASGWRGARSRASTRRTSSRPRASGGRPWSAWRESEDTAARAHARGQRRHAARGEPDRVRRAPHGEHVRRHPQRRGRDAHGLARHAAERLAWRIGGPGLYEPVHGSAPDIAGTGTANPLAMFGSVAMMLRHGSSLWKTPLLP